MTPKELKKLRDAKAKVDDRKEKKAELLQIEGDTLLLTEQKKHTERKVRNAEYDLFRYRTELSTYAQLSEKLLEYFQEADDTLEKMKVIIESIDGKDKFFPLLKLHGQQMETIAKMAVVSKAGFFTPQVFEDGKLEFIVRTQQQGETDDN